MKLYFTQVFKLIFNITPRPKNVITLIACIILWEVLLRSNFYTFSHNFLINYSCVKYEIPSHGIEQFFQLDIDKNKQLTLNEWLPYYYKNDPKHNKLYSKIDNSGYEEFLDIIQDTEITILKAYMTPLHMESTTKDYIAENKKNPKLFKGLLNWIEPNKNECNFSSTHFKIFLPPPSVNCGETWWIIPGVSDQTGEQASSFVYTSQNPSIFLEKLFQMFHHNPFLLTRFEPRGILAALKAKTDDILHITFRAHVEFQLEEPPNFPFWFTPSQFRGNLILNKDGTKIYAFEINLPNERDLNIDMEWLYGDNEKEHMEVDLGYVSLMKINSSTPSFTSEFESLQVGNIDWTCSINNSFNIIDEIMYPFLKTPYYNISQAFTLAKKDGKLIHTLVLYGALDDQSC